MDESINCTCHSIHTLICWAVELQHGYRDHNRHWRLLNVGFVIFSIWSRMRFAIRPTKMYAWCTLSCPPRCKKVGGSTFVCARQFALTFKYQAPPLILALHSFPIFTLVSHQFRNPIATGRLFDLSITLRQDQSTGGGGRGRTGWLKHSKWASIEQERIPKITPIAAPWDPFLDSGIDLVVKSYNWRLRLKKQNLEKAI